MFFSIYRSAWVALIVLVQLVPRVALLHAQTSTSNTHIVTQPVSENSRDGVSIARINTNRVAAGRMTGNTLTLDLDARMTRWFPAGDGGASLDVAAFAEAGKHATIPGPMVRVHVGTTVRISVRNSLNVPLTIFGLDTSRGAAADSVQILPGAAHTFQFIASSVGTFYYAGKTTRAPLVARHLEDSQLNGAIVVDPMDAAPSTANDQVFLISWWYKADSLSPSGLERATMAINGRSWPHTESLNVQQGDSLHWRWINLTLLNHPMHLHGFYYRVDGVGDGHKFQAYDKLVRREVVTEMVAPGATMQMTWAPSRVGNWIFHCHMATHMSHHVSINTLRGMPGGSDDHVHVETQTSTINTNPDALRLRTTQGDAGDESRASVPRALLHEMAGLVLGVRVTPKGGAGSRKHQVSTSARSGERALHLYVRSQAGVFGNYAGFLYSVHADTFGDSARFGKPGPTLVLQQNQPVAITIVNQSTEGAAVHWHGIELESFPDGVPGWSGNDRSTLPAIAPGDSLTVRFTPPRAGTFMYHSHFNEHEQIASGLHGAIVVLAPGGAYNAETDRVMMFSDDGPTTNLLSGSYPGARLNGSLSPTLEFRKGVTHRLRFINIRTDYIMSIRLSGGVNPVHWRVVAKDGRDLPRTQIVDGVAELKFAPGEIYDVEFTPGTSGEFVLEHRMAEVPPPLQGARYLPVVVR